MHRNMGIVRGLQPWLHYSFEEVVETLILSFYK